ncbi:MAG: hypothetical protein WC227_00870 [Patescibacteria group bacterium]
MNSEEIVKAVEAAVDTYKQDLDQVGKKQKQVLSDFIGRLEQEKMDKIRKEIVL